MVSKSFQSSRLSLRQHSSYVDKLLVFLERSRFRVGVLGPATNRRGEADLLIVTNPTTAHTGGDKSNKLHEEIPGRYCYGFPWGQGKFCPFGSVPA